MFRKVLLNLIRQEQRRVKMFSTTLKMQRIIKRSNAVVNKLSGWNRIVFSNKYLLYTNIAISLGLSATGDIIEQHFELYTNDLDEFNLRRTRNMSLSGATIGFLCHYWYKYIDVLLPGTTFLIAMKKMLLDQFVATPIYIGSFFLTLAVLDHWSLDRLSKEFKSKALTVYTAEWVVWPPAQLINYYLMPQRYRVLFDNTVSLGYDIFLSHVINKQNKSVNNI